MSTHLLALTFVVSAWKWSDLIRWHTDLKFVIYTHASQQIFYGCSSLIIIYKIHKITPSNKCRNYFKTFKLFRSNFITIKNFFKIFWNVCLHLKCGEDYRYLQIMQWSPRRIELCAIRRKKMTSIFVSIN